MRAKWRYVQSENIIEVYEIPYTTTTDIIIDKVVELSKAGKIREINDIRDETDLSGLRIAMDLKRGTDPDKLMQKLFKMTTLQDTFACNFNILISGYPKVMGVREILEEWTAWRLESTRRRVYFDLTKKKEKLHLLKGLEKILLDIDKAISIIRNTEQEEDVVPNLMMGFGIDEVQANFVADIRLRNINREYILKRTAETADLEKDIAELESVLGSRRKQKNLIIGELEKINEKYKIPRKTDIVYSSEIEEPEEEEIAEDYSVTVFLSQDGYLKKITAQSLRMSGEQKFKENDALKLSFEAMNNHDILVFTDRQQVYKAKLSDFEDGKASQLGVYLPSKLQMDDGEKVLTVIDPLGYTADVLFFFENGKVARVALSAYATKTNRRKLTGAYSDKSPLVEVLMLTEETNLACVSSDERMMVFNSSLLGQKTSRTTQGVGVMALKKQKTLVRAAFLADMNVTNLPRFRVKTIPAAGAVIRSEDKGEEQMTLQGM